MENQPSEAGRDPRSVPGSAPASRSRVPLIIAVIAVAGVAVAVGTYFGVKSSTDDAIAGLLTETSAPEAPGYDPATVDADTFENTLSRVQQMDYAGPKLNASMDEDTKLVVIQLEEAGWGDYNYFNRPVVEPSFDNTPQEIWDQITTGYAHVRNLAQLGEIEEATKLATAVAEGQEYDELVASLADGGDNKIEVGIGHDDGLYPATTTGTYSDIKSNGLGLISFKKESLATSKFDQVRVIARLTQGENPDSTRWVVVKTLPV